MQPTVEIPSCICRIRSSFYVFRFFYKQSAFLFILRPWSVRACAFHSRLYVRCRWIFLSNEFSTWINCLLPAINTPFHISAVDTLVQPPGFCLLYNSSFLNNKKIFFLFSLAIYAFYINYQVSHTKLLNFDSFYFIRSKSIIFLCKRIYFGDDCFILSLPYSSITMQNVSNFVWIPFLYNVRETQRIQHVQCNRIILHGMRAHWCTYSIWLANRNIFNI